jgi:transcriptional regulator with PAS, ATPase and Fis domain
VRGHPEGGAGHSQHESGEPSPKSLDSIRKSHIERVLQLAGGDLDKAAEMLVISPAELRSWMVKFGIG